MYWITVFGAIIAILSHVSSLAPPSFTGSWHHLYAKTDEDSEFIEYHNLGQLPVYVDVQVQPRNGDNDGYTFPGVGSAQSSDDVNKEIGGVVYMYDETRVVVKCPDGTNGVMQVIYTGEDWQPTYKQKEIEAWVRVRVWSPNDFPTPLFASGWLPISVNDATKTHLTVDTSLDQTSLANHFINVKVRVSDGGPLDDMVCDAQGSSLAFTSSSQWGGVIYQSRGSVFNIWTPAYRTDWAPGKGSICNMADGWGNLMKGYAEEGDVMIEVFDVIGSENFGDVTTIVRGANNQKSFTSGNLNVDTDIVVGKVYEDVGLDTYVWPAFGGVFFPQDEGQGYGGVVFAYSQSKVRMWHPDSKNGFYIDSNWGTEGSVTKYRDWTFAAKAHRVSTCGTPTSITNGEFYITGSQPYDFGVEVVYSCNPGLAIVSGDLVRTCAHFGWNGTLPVCGTPVVDCGTPSDVVNGTVSFTGTTENETGYVTCYQGFGLIGSANITCHSNGSWSTLPSCSYIATMPNCSTPAEVSNGTVNYDPSNTLHGDTANITCNPGYNISGNSTITCQDDGSWSTLPYCILIINCSNPQQVENGSVSTVPGRTLQGDTANITCNPGFNLSGNSIITCQQNGTWTTLPSCVPAYVTVNCSNPQQVDNGTVYFTPGHTVLADTANVTCNYGFNISGNSIITCQENGSWTTLPSCVSADVTVNCSNPQQIENGTVYFAPGQTLLADTANVTCNYGFNISGNSIITCQENGTWTTLPICMQISSISNCSTPPQVENGTVSFTPGQTLSGDTAIITCNVGFNISGNATIICQDSGDWTSLPTCIAVTQFVNCSTPPNMDNGTVVFASGETLVGDTANITCNVGFNISGNATITCQDSGDWTTLPTCISVTQYVNCSTPPNVDNGTLVFASGETLVGDTANITCNVGYNISGNSVITCQENATWSTLPTCIYSESELCYCSCNTVSGSSNTNTTLEEQILEIVKNLTVQHKSTSKYRRTKESADDDRTSAVTMGYVGGVFLGVSFGFILFLDVSNIHRILMSPF